VSWRVVTTPAGWSDVERFGNEEQFAISNDLMAWVDAGPPRRTLRLGANVFEDDIPAGYRITYFVNDAEQYVAIVRVRKA